ncbi:MAG: thiamine-phosphate kinase [Pseudomonadota bacterium]
MHETDWITRYIAPLVTADGAAGLRDDVALLRTIGPTLATMDTLIECVHFLPDDPLDTIGQKLLRVNVSDIHAKGAEPLEALLSIAWPVDRDERAFELLMTGIGKDLQAFGISLIGGDLVQINGPLALTLTLTGRCIAKGPVRRDGGAPGDTLLINGEIGWGGLGLAAAKAGQDPETAARYRVPAISPIGAAKTVAELAASSLDVSDGLLIDAMRLADASGCGADIRLDHVPLAAPSDQVGAILKQCTSGDDYRILISARTDQPIPGFVAIGTLTETRGLALTLAGAGVNTPSTLGFEHKG